MDSFDQKTAADWIAEAMALAGHSPEEFAGQRQCYERAMELEPGNWEVLYRYGRCLCGYSPDWVGEGIPYLEKAAEINPSDANILVHLSSALVNCGKAAEGAAVLDKALQLDPNNAEAHFHRSLQLSGEGAPILEVMKEVVQCLQSDPTHPMARMLYRQATGKDFA